MSEHLKASSKKVKELSGSTLEELTLAIKQQHGIDVIFIVVDSDGEVLVAIPQSIPAKWNILDFETECASYMLLPSISYKGWYLT